MAVQSEQMMMDGTSLSIVAGLIGQPLKKRHHATVTSQNETLGMPLYAKYAFILAALYRFYYAIAAGGRDA